MANKQDLEQLRRTIADCVKMLRKSSGLTQEQLSERAGIAPQYLSRVETARHIPSLETIIDLAEALGTTPAALLGGQQSGTGVDRANRVAAMLEGLDDTDAAFLEAQLADWVTHSRGRKR